MFTNEPHQTVDSLKHVQPLLDFGGIHPKSRRHHGRIELVALYAGRYQQVTVVVTKLTDLLLAHAANRLGQLLSDHRKLAHHDPAAAVLSQHTAVSQKPREIRHEERITFRPVMDSSGELRRKEMLRKSQCEVAIHIGTRQKRHRNLGADSVSLQLQLHA